MKAHTASLINAVILILFSLWGYFASETPSVTAFIPAAIGLILLLCNPGIRTQNKVIAHVAVVLTLVALIGLVMPLRGALDRSDNPALLRVGVMMLSTLLALVYFIKSFRDARKARAAKNL